MTLKKLLLEQLEIMRQNKATKEIMIKQMQEWVKEVDFIFEECYKVIDNLENKNAN